MPSLESLMAVKPLWDNAQKPMTRVRRWSNAPGYDQTLSDHVCSLPIVGIWVCSYIKEHLPKDFDYGLLYAAFALHDHGETVTAINGNDVVLDEKTNLTDMEEIEAFNLFLTEVESKEVLAAFWRPYMLQFCRKSDGDILRLSKGAREYLLRMKMEVGIEPVIFEFCERLDYIFSALHGHDNGVMIGPENMLEHTLKRNAEKLDEICEEVPGLKEVWSDQLRRELFEPTAT